MRLKQKIWLPVFPIVLGAWMAAEAGAQDCLKLTNFNAQCTQASAPRQFQCNVSVQALQNAPKVRLLSAGGTLNGQPSVEAPVQGGVAQFNFTYNEAQFSPSMPIQAQLVDAQGNGICRIFLQQQLPACGSNCSQSTAAIVLTGNAGMFSSRAAPAYNRPGISCVGAVANIPAGAPKVQSISYEVLSAERRPKCANAPNAAWQAAALAPLSPQQSGSAAGNPTLTGLRTAVRTINAKVNNSMDWTLTVGLPAMKLQPNCAEEYRVNLRVTVTFENGCTVSQTFNQVPVTWP